MNKANKELENHMKGSGKLHLLIMFIYIIGHILSNVCLSRGITEEIFLHLSECYWQPCKQLARPPQLKCCFIWLFWVFWQYQFLTILCATIATWFFWHESRMESIVVFKTSPGGCLNLKLWFWTTWNIVQVSRSFGAKPLCQDIFKNLRTW